MVTGFIFGRYRILVVQDPSGDRILMDTGSCWLQDLGG